MMTVNKTENNSNRNQKEEKLKINNIVYVIEVFILTAIAVFLSIIGGVNFSGLTGLLCFVTASALFSCVLFLTSPGVIIISGVASFAITFTLNGNMVSSLASLIYVITGAIIYFGVRGKKNRTQITVRIALVMALFYLGLLVLSLFLETGTFSLGMVSSMIDSELTKGAEYFVQQYNSVITQYAGAGTGTGASIEETAQTAYFIELYIKELVLNLKAIIPACFILYNALIAYLATLLFKPAYNIFIPLANPNRKKIKNNYWRVNISVVSAIIMSVALFLSLILSKENNIIAAIVLTNLVYILAPGFCLMGIYFAYDKIFKSRSGILPVVIIVGAVMLVFIYPAALLFILYSSLSVLMAVGLYAAMIEDARKLYDRAKKAILGDGNDNDENDDDDYLD